MCTSLGYAVSAEWWSRHGSQWSSRICMRDFRDSGRRNPSGDRLAFVQESADASSVGDLRHSRPWLGRWASMLQSATVIPWQLSILRRRPTRHPTARIGFKIFSPGMGTRVPAAQTRKFRLRAARPLPRLCGGRSCAALRLVAAGFARGIGIFRGSAGSRRRAEPHGLDLTRR